MKDTQRAEIGIIGGSGLYALTGLRDVREVRVKTPFGPPSDVIVTGRLADRRVAFLARHGRGHRVMPTEINFRANIFALKLLGVSRLLSIGAVGSLQEGVHPGEVVIPDQFYDHTKHRDATFFGRGLVVHVAFANPVCTDLARLVGEATRAAGSVVHEGGLYLCIEGPQFSSQGESFIYRQWGARVIGMTAMPEAKLAREAELCYATLALVTDYDCWYERAKAVTAEAVLQVLQRNVELAKKVISLTLTRLPRERTCPCATALKDAIVTPRRQVPASTRARLRPIVGRYLS